MRKTNRNNSCLFRAFRPHQSGIDVFDVQIFLVNLMYLVVLETTFLVIRVREIQQHVFA